jgi:hypothetical protein
MVDSVANFVSQAVKNKGRKYIDFQ